MPRPFESRIRYARPMMRRLTETLTRRLGPVAGANLMLKTFAWTKVPMIFRTGLQVVELDDEGCVVRIPFRKRNRNHLGSLYFGVLIVGADVAGGMPAFRMAQASGHKISFAFKDVSARFLKRAEAETLFTCRDGAVIRDALAEAVRTGERVNRGVHVTATTPSCFGNEPVAEFDLTLSIRVSG